MDLFSKSNPFKKDEKFKSYTVYVKYEDGHVIANHNITNVHPYMAKIRKSPGVKSVWYE